MCVEKQHKLLAKCTALVLSFCSLLLWMYFCPFVCLLSPELLISHGRWRTGCEAWCWIFPSQRRTWGFWCEVFGFQHEETYEMKGVRIHHSRCGRTLGSAGEVRRWKDIWQYQIFCMAMCVQLSGVQWKLFPEHPELSPVLSAVQCSTYFRDVCYLLIFSCAVKVTVQVLQTSNMAGRGISLLHQIISRKFWKLRDDRMFENQIL